METMEATVDRLPAKRRELLLLLKKRGEAGADELADQFGVTASAIRQQLDLLAEEGLVAHREDRGSRGRPRHRYHLTPEAEVLFPKTYSELTNELLDYVRDSDPDLVEAIFERRRQRRVEGAVARLAGMSFPERVAELARILDEDGYLADFEALPDGTFLVTEHNCAIPATRCGSTFAPPRASWPATSASSSLPTSTQTASCSGCGPTGPPSPPTGGTSTPAR